eukprot:7385235-Prymnesium_polylepis.1
MHRRYVAHMSGSWVWEREHTRRWRTKAVKRGFFLTRLFWSEGLRATWSAVYGMQPKQAKAWLRLTCRLN